MVKIKARSIGDRFRRAGITFNKAPAEYTVTEKTLAILKDEPMLVVEVLPDPESEKDTGKGDTGKKKG